MGGFGVDQPLACGIVVLQYYLIKYVSCSHRVEEGGGFSYSLAQHMSLTEAAYGDGAKTAGWTF